MKLAVIICTYDRKNMSSKDILINMFKMLEEQTYKDFKVFIIGDSYTNDKEFKTLCENYDGEIYYENSPVHFREGYFNLKENKWSCCGCNSRLIGIKKAIQEKYDYYFHLDDDDIWKKIIFKMLFHI
jgi:GT2 family glycosyltransferase